MAQPLLDFQITPTLETILMNYDVDYIVPFHVQLLSGGVISAHELVVNANAKVKFSPFCVSFYNLEGATRIIYFNTQTPKILIAGSVTTATSFLYSNAYSIIFDKLGFSGALANAGTTLTFNGLRIVLN
jgi:hypothetical protein